MSCKELDGPCDLKFQGETLDAIVEKVKNHGYESAQKGNRDHEKAWGDLKEIMDDPEQKEKWLEQKQREFDALPEVD